MPYIPLNIVSEKTLTQNVSVNIPYPSGKNQGNFFGSFNHTLGIESRFFRSPQDFMLIPTPECLILNWRSKVVIEKNSILHFQIEELGGDYYFDNKTGVTVHGMVASPLFMVNLQTPLPENPIFYLPETIIKSSGTLPIVNSKPDVARNVVIKSSAVEFDITFRIEGSDPYGRPVVEDLDSFSEYVAIGKKAFTEISRISVNNRCAGEISIGTGRRFGLPSFLPASGYLISAIFGGKAINNGVAIAGETGIPDFKSGDRRGTYEPPSSVLLDGKTPLHLLVSLPNAGNIGAHD